MSPGNQGVFQLLKEVTFRRILTFCSSWEGCLSCATDWLVGLVRKEQNYDCFDDHRYGKVDDVEILVHDVCFNVPPRYIESQFETEIMAESG